MARQRAARTAASDTGRAAAADWDCSEGDGVQFYMCLSRSGGRAGRGWRWQGQRFAAQPPAACKNTIWTDTDHPRGQADMR
mmetsp:Transcript_57261/g.152512  ORF Transcript_57261/g.152512 Transcript_57261/m.152512 type:complete len:81 (-) Transcript_57261:183-425(-)